MVTVLLALATVTDALGHPPEVWEEDDGTVGIGVRGWFDADAPLRAVTDALTRAGIPVLHSSVTELGDEDCPKAYAEVRVAG